MCTQPGYQWLPEYTISPIATKQLQLSFTKWQLVHRVFWERIFYLRETLLRNPHLAKPFACNILSKLNVFTTEKCSTLSNYIDDFSNIKPWFYSVPWADWLSHSPQLWRNWGPFSDSERRNCEDVDPWCRLLTSSAPQTGRRVSRRPPTALPVLRSVNINTWYRVSWPMKIVGLPIESHGGEKGRCRQKH